MVGRLHPQGKAPAHMSALTPHFWQEDLWNQNRSSERKGVRVKGRTAVCVLEEAADGKDGLTWGREEPLFRAHWAKRAIP